MSITVLAALLALVCLTSVLFLPHWSWFRRLSRPQAMLLVWSIQMSAFVLLAMSGWTASLVSGNQISFWDYLGGQQRNVKLILVGACLTTGVLLIVGAKAWSSRRAARKQSSRPLA